ncbi:MAG: extracellular solute-binding protein [Anaerolineales bacterium]|jgi:multiple sugar transport system substrate-binding protein|nr:extracellular solute-binding protein [Anaerolineales bacterium]
MTQELEFSAIFTTHSQVEFLERCLEDFEKKTRIHVNVQWLQWATARAELVKMAIYHHGADVSEIGSTWISDFIAMNALRAYTNAEIEAVGGAQAFVPAAWMSGKTLPEEQVWAIPWVISPVIIAYRRDLLQKAGVNAETGFKTFQAFHETLAKIQASGWEMPLALPLHRSQYSTLHNISSWIWGAGSDFLDPVAKQVTFHHPAALAAIKDYYALRHYFHKDFANQEDKTVNHSKAFWEGQAAIAIGGSWLLTSTSDSAIVEENMAAAPLPGPSFVGAQSLVVWEHTRNPEAALALVKYLTDPATLDAYTSKFDLMPARLDLLSQGRYTTPPHSVLALAAKTGRSFPAIPLLGLVEDKLSLMVENLWDDVCASSESELDAIVQRAVIAQAERLNMILSG